MSSENVDCVSGYQAISEGALIQLGAEPEAKDEDYIERTGNKEESLCQSNNTILGELTGAKENRANTAVTHICISPQGSLNASVSQGFHLATMKGASVVCGLAEADSDQDRTLPLHQDQWTKAMDRGWEDGEQRVCYQSEAEQIQTMRRLSKAHFYRKSREIYECDKLLGQYEQFHKCHTLKQKQKKLIKLKGRHNTNNNESSKQQLSDGPLAMSPRWLRKTNPSRQQRIQQHSSSKFLNLTLAVPSLARRHNAGVLVTPAKKHLRSTGHVTSIFMTGQDSRHQNTTASKRHGIRLFSRSKERESVNGDDHTVRAPPLQRLCFGDSDKRNQTCCPSSSGDNTAATEASFTQPNIKRGKSGKRIKPITQLFCKQVKAIKLRRNPGGVRKP